MSAEPAPSAAGRGAPRPVRPEPGDVLRWTGAAGPAVPGPAGVVTEPAESATDLEGDEAVPDPEREEDPEREGEEVVPASEAVESVPGPTVVTGARETVPGAVERAPAPSAGPAGEVPAARSGTVGGTTGSARRCTGGVADDLVSGTGRVAGGGAGATRGPVGPLTVTGVLMRRTGSGPAPSADSSSPGDATGRERDGSSSPEAGRAVGASTPLTSPPGAPSRTACDSVPVKEGFCQVVSRPPNPASATEPLPAVAR
ncbi:hypothetical protein SM007_37440 [Streptomyces avermitilis]|uniref:Uncharacterized protein n=1 Tax=Streptomyces avermitilis TaxID=33903 RepID=A0A4D4M8P8_STRAX|nr:hypothetical protein [Streptomyces avermitilis]OOV17915.1 hypothetical protein SM007_37440 [Streptomyces avermitilis]GDY67927.1 hypothetical protein SAV14893_073200 [Streptomyces avermitilis]GDY80928.1 hypothetical protein SAVCW2_01270 [Streptomyces avermitilis]